MINELEIDHVKQAKNNRSQYVEIHSDNKYCK
jgi:hypothetical protein